MADIYKEAKPPIALGAWLTKPHSIHREREMLSNFTLYDGLSGVRKDLENDFLSYLSKVICWLVLKSTPLSLTK